MYAAHTAAYIGASTIFTQPQSADETPQTSVASTRWPDQLQEPIHYLEYSQSTGKVYLYRVRLFDLKQPRDIGTPQVEAFLSMPAAPQAEVGIT